MNVLIISTNRNRQPVPVMPLGACIVAEAAERAGHRVRLLDTMFTRAPLKSLRKELALFPPDVVGISVRNIDNNDRGNPRFYFDDLEPLLRCVNERSAAPLVLGGAAVGVMPREALLHTGASVAVIGSGEAIFPRLLARLAEPGAWKDIPGIAWIENNRYVRTRGAGAHFSGDQPVPDFSRWIDPRPYLSRLAAIPVQTKRGCPFECVYCTYAMSEGKAYCLRDPGAIAEAVKKLEAQGFRDVEFVDNVFNAPYEHALALCAALAKARTRVRFQTLELNPLSFDDRLLSSMEEAGFSGIGITAESASGRVLERLRKNYTPKEVHQAADVIRRHRLPCLWMFLLGGPGETRETVEETVRFARDNVRPGDVAFFNIGIRIYPGTALETVAREEGVLTLAPEEMFRPVSYLSPGLDERWLAATLKEALERHRNFVDINALSFPFLSALCRWGRLAGATPPLWKYTRKFRRVTRWLPIGAPP